MKFNEVIEKVNEYIGDKDSLVGAILFENGIISFDDGSNNFNISVHLGGFHDKMNISSEGRIHDDVNSYLSDDWEAGDEERIVYEDKVVIFGLDNLEDNYLQIYSYESCLEESLEL